MFFDNKFYVLIVISAIVPAIFETTSVRILKNPDHFQKAKNIVIFLALISLILFLIWSNIVVLYFLIPLYQLFIYSFFFNKFQKLYGRYPKYKKALGRTGNPFSSFKSQLFYKLNPNNVVKEMPDRTYYAVIAVLSVIPVLIFYLL